jgi:hypothetical protein
MVYVSLCRSDGDISRLSEVFMKKLIVCMPVLIATTLGLLPVGCSDSAMSRREAKPELGERLSGEAVKGKVTRVDGDYLWIKEDDGKEVRVHIDDRTKLDKVVAGDRAKAYINKDGHATTVQRLD